ncbi:MAG: signal peptide peptidase SppA [Ignavibacteria bacterium]
MKKNPLLFLSLFILLTFQNIFPQDIDLFNPSNEMYQFSANDEGANAFRLNPAVLGLKHKLNLNLNFFINNYLGSSQLDEYDILINAGNFGLSYRNAITGRSAANDLSVKPFSNELSTISLGFGIGNKSLDVGVLAEWLNMRKIESADFFDSNMPRFRGGFGFLFRPSGYISTAVTVKYDESFSQNNTPCVKYTVGAAVRPFIKDWLTFLADFSCIPYTNSGFFEKNLIKLGCDIKAADGVHFNGNFTRINDINTDDYFNFGVRFDLPNFSARYNNSFHKFTDWDNSFTSYRSAGSDFSLSFNLEKRKSIIRESKKIVEITLSGSLQDYSTDDVFFGVLGKGERSIHEVIADIDYASKDESIRGMLLKIYPHEGTRIVAISAAVEELTNALERFKSKGKKITAYFPEDAGPVEYYIATFANDIVMPDEAILFYGLSIDVMNYKQFLQKYGIELQTFYAGKYKLTFQGLLDSTTTEAKEVINRILDIVYDKMNQRVITARNITLDDYMREKLSQPVSGREAKRLGLVDANGWYQDAKDLVEKNNRSSRFLSNVNRSVWDDGWGEPDAIAVVGVHGTITSGESEAPDPIQIPFLSKGRSTGSETVVRQLEDAFANPRVKAIILRVDSGGGSALASAEINAAIIRLKKKYKKPLYVSMGFAAASGGYYVSCNADKIFCDELTVTGSIGVFGAKPNLDSLMQSQKIRVETFKRGEHSDIGSLYKELSPDELEILQGLIDYYYDRFISTVSEGRKLSKSEVEQVAQGRVWLGTDAFNKRLVDEIGGLYETVNYAKKEAHLSSRFRLVYYAVPGGSTIDDIVTNSIVKYLEHSLAKLFGFEDDKGIEVKE